MKNTLEIKAGKHLHSVMHASHHDQTLIRRLRKEMNKIFDDYGHGFRPGKVHWGEEFSQVEARIDVQDCDEEIIVHAEIPGVELEELNISATPHYLSITGEKKRECDEAKKGFYHVERQYGYFRRVVLLPCEVDRDKVKAVFKHGILKVTLPKSQAELKQTHRIEIKTEQ